MKRSEMLKDISILIGDGLKNQHSVETMSRSILEYQESQGMLPPPEKFEEVTSYLGYAYYSNVVPDMDGNVDIIKSQLWEEEDE